MSIEDSQEFRDFARHVYKFSATTEAALEGVHNKVAELERTVARLLDDVRLGNGDRKPIMQRLQSVESDLERLMPEIAQFKDEVDKLRKSIDRLHEDLEERQQARDNRNDLLFGMSKAMLAQVGQALVTALLIWLGFTFLGK